MRTPLIVLVLLSLVSCKTASEQTRITAIIGGTLIASRGVAPLADAVVIVDGARIRAAGPRATTPIPAGSEKIDASGFTVEPGRVAEAYDLAMFAEPELTRRLNRYLAGGVTTVRIDNPGAAASSLAAAQSQGTVLTARVLPTAHAEAPAIAPGRAADIVLLSNAAVKRVMLNGEWIVLDALPR